MKFDQNKVRKQKEFKSPEGTRREGPPFPHNLSTRVSKIHLHNPILERRREEGTGRRRRAPGGRRGVLLWAPEEKREGGREGVRGLLNPTTLNPKRLNYP